MLFTRWLSSRRGLSLRLPSRRRTPAARPTFRPTLQALEDRWLPSTLTVLNNLDSGPGSLRAAIATAHNADTIVFAPSLNGQTITLTSGELLIKHSMTIAGPGAGNLTISGHLASRVFEVGGNSGANVTLSGLMICNGVAHDAIGGGAIENLAGDLTVSNCTLTGNSAPQGGGGALANGGHTMTVSDCTLSGNSASSGGAIVTHNAVTVIHCTISGNTAAQGGGIWDSSGTLTLNQCTVSGNVATSAGGGLYISPYGTTTVENSSSITGNTLPLGVPEDVYNQGVLYLDSTSTIGIRDGNPAVPI
jgi:hypothetical protein